MTTVAALEGHGVICTDRAWNQKMHDGTVLRGTIDGRLRRVPGGFAVASGDGPMIAAGLEVLAGAGLADVDAVRAVLASTLLRLSPAIRKQYPGAEPERTAFLMLREADDGVEALGVAATGKVFGAGPSTLLASWPPELAPDAVRKMYGALRGALARATTPDDTARAVVEAAGIVAPLAPSMSHELELAVLTRNGDGFTHETRRLEC